MAAATFKEKFSIEENPSITYQLEYFRGDKTYTLTEVGNSVPISKGRFEINKVGKYIMLQNDRPDIMLNIDGLSGKFHLKAVEVFNEFMKNRN